MKLHLPLSLRSSIYALFAAAMVGSTVQAGIMHSDASIITYTDFGQNEGRYSVGVTNELLQYIREQDGGVTITYIGGQQTYVMPNGMIDFGAAYYLSTCAAISPSAVASCAHYYTFNSSFTNLVYGIGETNAVKYKGIELTAGDAGNNRWTSDKFSYTVNGATNAASGNATDHKVMRLSKVITDAPYSEVYTGGVSGDMTFYHAGSGQMWLSTYDTNTLINKSYPNSASSLSGSHNYVVGGIVSGAALLADSGTSKGYYATESFRPEGISSSDPLTWVSRPGDSGSPLYVWNEATGTYQYIGSNRGEMLSGQVGSAFVTAPTFDKDVVENRYTKRVNLGSVGTVYLNGVTKQGETVTDSWGNSATKWHGTVTGEGLETVSFNGLQSGLNTWADLSSLKDTQNWYAYGEDKVIQNNQTLFLTENLVFTADAGSAKTIVLNDTVDLGIGYAEFNGGKFTIQSAAGGVALTDDGLLPVLPDAVETYLFNHAGYVINEGTEVHLQLTNPSSYMREWRKIGAGDLYIEGSGNNDALLNLGGSGKTYLNRTNGYAAYNVLVNTGATVVISDANQIKRDLTFGNRGGTLDMNGRSMDWYTTAEAGDTSRDGFSINALTEDALIANYSGSSTLTYKESGNTTYLGSFADSADSSLKVVYDVADGTWTLNSIRTSLQHADSGLQVEAGRVILSGTNTIHAVGSESGRNQNRYSHDDDWHYADAAMNVTVADGGTFELGSHARLTGDVTVNQGGTYVMREGVRHQMEYVEGGQLLEDTSRYAAFYGHKGDVNLDGGTFAVQFLDGVDAATSYSGNVTGTGAMTVDAGADGGMLIFSGGVSDQVSKTLNRGQLLLAGDAAADTTHKWLVNAGGVMVQQGDIDSTLALIDASSTGIIGLTGDYSAQISLGAHSGMGIGALGGTTVQYGAAGTTETLTPIRLGGAGKLVVNYVLAGDTTLTVDGCGMRGGEINLQQVAADYTGIINVSAREGGQMILTTAREGALQGATVNLNSGGVFRLDDAQQILAGTFNVNTGGLLQGNHMQLTSGSVELSGNMDYESFTVTSGATLNLRNGGRLDAGHAVTIAQEGVMRLNAQTLQDKVELENGGIMYGNGSTIGASANVLATAGTGKLSAGEGTLTINGQVGAAEGATLRLEGGTVNFNVQNINAAGGTLELACNAEFAYRVNNATQNIGGTLSIAENVTLSAQQGNPNSNQGITHNINHIHIQNGKTLTLSESGSDWRHVFNIASLTGSGEFIWQGNWHNFDHSAMGPSRLVLSGDNSFSGTLGVYVSDSRGCMHHVSLAHDNAARNMVIYLVDNGERGQSALSINTENAHIAGLKGEEYTHVYAGPINGNNPGSTALNTLSINTAADTTYEYSGKLHGDATNGLNLVKSGIGTQTFTNSANVLHDVSALQGHLNFTAAPTIHGDVSIAQGAELTIGSGAYTLASGQRLNVLSGAEGESAVLHNELVLSGGGTLHFEAYGSSAETAALSTAGVSSTGGTTLVSFGNTAAIQLGNTQWLASGDWSAAGNFSAVTPEYLQAAISASSSGLLATFAMQSGFTNWAGSESVLTSGAKVVFAGIGGVNEASLTSARSIGTGYFDNEETFTVSGGALSMTRLEKSGAGELVLNSAVSANTLEVKETTTITGSGSLQVGTLQLQADLTTGMAVSLTSSLNVSSQPVKWTMDGEFTQSLTATQVNKLASVELLGGASLSMSVSEANQLTTSITGTGGVIMTGSGAFTKNNATELNIAGAESLESATLKGSGVVNVSGKVNIAGLLSLGKGTVNLLKGAEVSASSFKAGDTADGQPSTLNIESGASLTVSGNADADSTTTSFMLTHWPSSSSTLRLNGGTLTAQNTSLYMGRDSSGRFEANAGTATFKGIRFSREKNNADTFILGSATLNIGATGIIDMQANDTVQLGGGIIRATSDFQIWGKDPANYYLTLTDDEVGTVFDTNGHTITSQSGFSGAGGLVKRGAGTLYLQRANNYTGTTTVEQGTLKLDSALGSGKYVVKEAGTLELSPAGGTRTIDGSEDLEIAGTLLLRGSGTTNISCKLDIGGCLSLGKGIVNLLEGAAVTTKQYISGNSANDQPTSTTIGRGASLTITGEENGDVDKNGTTFQLAHWKRSGSSLKLDGGTLNATGACLHMGWDSAGRFEALSGTATLKGIRFSSKNGGQADIFSLGSAETGDARVNIGAGGIKGIQNNDTVNLGNGTIGASADFAISGSNAVNLIGTVGGTIFDSNGYTIAVNTAVAGDGKLVKTGEGTLLLAGSGTDFCGSIAVNAGILAVDTNGQSVLESAASVHIGNGTLDLSRLNLIGAEDTISISEAQTFTLSEKSSLVLGSLTANTQYQVFDFSSGYAEGWNELTAERISIGGVTLSSMNNGRVSYTIGEDGSFSYSLLDDRAIVWSGGGEAGVWNDLGRNQVWQDASGAGTAFVNYDSVVFRSAADLTLEGEIRVNDITLEAGVSLKTAGKLIVHGTKTLGEGFSWEFSGDTTLSFTEEQLKKTAGIVVGEDATLVMTDKQTAENNTSAAFNKVSGTGDVELNLSTADNGVGFNLSGVSGDISVASGRLQVNTSTFNEKSTIRLASSSSYLVFNADGTELKNDVVLGATNATMLVNNGCKGTISGDLLGDSKKLTKDGDGSLTLSGNVRLGVLETSKGDVIIDTISALINNVDTSIGGDARGKVKLAKDAYLGITSNVWSNSYTGFELGQDAELELRKNNLRIINNSSETASLTSSVRGQYSLTNAAYEIKNARVVYTGSSSATLSNKLTKVVIVNDNAISPAEGEEGNDGEDYTASTLTVNNADNNLSGVAAYGGDVHLENLKDATSLNLLEIAAGRTVMAYVDSNTETCSAVTVTEAARLSGGAMLKAASLTLADGATLDMVNLGETGMDLCGGALTFGSGVTMGEELLASVGALDYAESLVLFTGLSGVSLPAVVATESDRVLASSIFSNVQSETLYVTYQTVDNVGSLLVVNVPEPATSTLGLLALTALAARRRRK